MSNQTKEFQVLVTLLHFGAAVGENAASVIVYNGRLGRSVAFRTFDHALRVFNFLLQSDGRGPSAGSDGRLLITLRLNGPRLNGRCCAICLAALQAAWK